MTRILARAWLEAKLTPTIRSPPLRCVLQVLNVGGNQVSGKLKIQGMPKLRALIANDNAITAVKGVHSAVRSLTIGYRVVYLLVLAPCQNFGSAD